MPIENLTAEGLPIVTREAINTLLAILDKQGEADFEDMVDEMSNQNTDLYGLIQRYSESRVGSFTDGFMSGAIIVYEALRRQQAANRLRSTIR